MKNLRSTGFLWSLMLGIILSGCTNDTIDEADPGLTISKQVIEKVVSVGLNPDGMTIDRLVRPDGTEEDVYVIEGDIAMSAEQLAEMSIYDGITSEQYRTNNLVNPGVIQVIGYTGGSNGLTLNMQTALLQAVNEYNNLNLTIRFDLTFAPSTNGDIIVYKTSGGSIAGFPANGKPYKWIALSDSFSSVSVSVLKILLMHEIGHSIGLRHTDWFSRQSCGQNVSEGDAGVGAIHIPGTTTGFDPDSIMLACFTFSTNGGFSANDIIALQFLY